MAVRREEDPTFGKAFEDAFGGGEEDARKKQVKARVGLFSPGGPLAQQLAMNSTVLIVNDTVFAHGGLLPRHVEFGLERLNNSVSDWMRGKEISDEKDRTALGMAIGSVKDSVVWNRQFSTENFTNESDIGGPGVWGSGGGVDSHSSHTHTRIRCIRSTREAQ